MTYELHRLAAGSFDLVHDGVVIGSVVRGVSRDGEAQGWHAELLEDLPPLPEQSPDEACRVLPFPYSEL